MPNIKPNDLPLAGSVPEGLGLCRDSSGNLVWDSGNQLHSSIDSIKSIANKKFSGLRKLFGARGVSAWADTTWCLQATAKGQFYKIRLVFENSGATPVPLDGCKIAPSPTASNNGQSLTWTAVTFSSLTSSTIPAATNPDSISTINGRLVSDVITVASVDRTDIVGANPLLQIRAKVSGAVIWFVPSLNATPQGFATINQYTGANDGAVRSASDGVTTPSSLAMTPSDQQVFAPFINVEFFYTQPVIDIVACGDSTFVGIASNSYVSWLQIGTALASSSSQYYEIDNQSIASRTQTQAYNAAVANLFGSVVGKYFLWQGWSTNNNTNASDFLLAKQQTIDIIDRCKAAGILPIVTTDPVRNYNNATVKSSIDAHNAWLKTLGVPCFDIATLISNGSGTGIADQYTIDSEVGSKVHWNNAGNQYLGQQFSYFIANLV